ARSPSRLQPRAEQLNVPDMHAGAQERLDQTAPVDDLEHAGLQRGPARLVMRREAALDDARLDAVAKELARREQSGRTGPDDQDGRLGCRRIHRQSPLASTFTAAGAARLAR